MVRMTKCQDCGAPTIPGITPASPGWCSMECDLKTNPGFALSGDPIYYTGEPYVGCHTATGTQVVYFKEPILGLDIPVHLVGGEIEDLDEIRIAVSGEWEAIPAEVQLDLF